MGITGSGKSSFISCLAEEAIAAVGHTLASCTRDVSVYSFEHKSGRRVFLIDTPGFDDTNHGNTVVLSNVANFLAQVYNKKVRLSGIVYLHRINDNRMTGSSMKTLDLFKQLCGDDAFEHIVLATTMWNNVARETGKQREKDLKENDRYWGLMWQKGSTIIRHDSKESAMKIVEELLKRNSRVVLNIQRELVDEHKTLEDTAAGQTVSKELTELKKQNERTLQELQASHRDELCNRDAEFAEIRKIEREELEEKISAAVRAREALKMDYGQLVQQQAAQYGQLLAALQHRQEEHPRIDAQQLRAALQAETGKPKKSALKITVAVCGALIGVTTAGIGLVTANAVLIGVGITGVGTIFNGL
ncbi:hypothetical protein D6D28_07883 [Aureobasidium pullulans]|uniref:G domain-containing protein n=1 Tax=Aureobasidium pullulans TaxID=5580 RepID=A0A4S8S9E4_AURPU|nr:hypothetical protein D6D28_07883 [Aureobasidium pullulans]